MSIRLRQWARRSFIDPKPSLIALRKYELSPELAMADSLVARLRINSLRPEREARIACLFAIGIEARTNASVQVSIGESEDFDFLARWVVGDETHYVPVQLKELAPEDLNEAHSLEELQRSLAPRLESEAALLVHLNRLGSVEFSVLATFAAPFREIWFLWAGGPRQTEWHIFGDVRGSPSQISFDYPADGSE